MLQIPSKGDITDIISLENEFKKDMILKSTFKSEWYHQLRLYNSYVPVLIELGQFAFDERRCKLAVSILDEAIQLGSLDASLVLANKIKLKLNKMNISDQLKYKDIMIKCYKYVADHGKIEVYPKCADVCKNDMEWFYCYKKAITFNNKFIAISSIQNIVNDNHRKAHLKRYRNHSTEQEKIVKMYRQFQIFKKFEMLEKYMTNCELSKYIIKDVILSIEEYLGIDKSLEELVEMDDNEYTRVVLSDSESDSGSDSD